MDITKQIERGKDSQKDPVVSIIIPNYNTAGYIGLTLDSVFAQTFREYEVIVINDGSPDTSELHDVLAPYRERIVFLDKSSNDGTSATRNVGAEIASGQYLSFLDADDIWEPEFLEKTIRYLHEEGLDMAYADCDFFENEIAEGYYTRGLNPKKGLITRRSLIDGECHILPSGSLMTRSVFDKAGRFDPSVKRTEDFDLWMRMVFNGARIGFLDELLFHFRLSPESGSGDAVVRLQRSIDCWTHLRAKLPFTEEELSSISRSIGIQEAAISRMKARDHIYRSNWKEAADEMRLAQKKAADLRLPLKHRLKLKLGLLLLRTRPTLLRKIYLKQRAAEIKYLPSRTGA